MRSLQRLSTLVAISLLVVGCNRGPDTKKQVSDALKTNNIQDVDVNYDRDSKVVHLQGKVETAAEKARAEQVAAQVVGTSGRVLNELSVEGPNENKVDDLDGRIRDTLNDRVKNDPELKERDINFDVNNGAVEVKGKVATAAEKNRVSEMVRSVHGVRDVANTLEVKPADYRNKR